MINVIELDTLKGFPLYFLNELTSHRKTFLKYDHLETFEDDYKIKELIKNIDNYCLENMIFGYHYTRAIYQKIEKEGLKIRSGEKIRKDFLENHGNLFTLKQINIINKKWNQQFDDDNKGYRDNLLFFNLIPSSLPSLGTEYLLKYFGGEQVYFPLCDLDKIGQILTSIGTPLLIKAKLNPQNLKTYIEYPWGKIAVSSFHRKINKNASIIDQDASQNKSVSPKNIEIIRIEKHQI